LKFLQTLKPPCKHVIPLVETIQTNTGTCVVFPERQSIKEQLHCFTDGGDLRGMFLDLDIKPSNLVYTNESRPRLEIIDFDIARLMYSPMKADKWSCGRVLRLFSERHGKADEGLRGFAARLMNGNPRNRPPLLEWHEHRTKVTFVVPKKRRRVDVNMPGIFVL